MSRKIFQRDNTLDNNERNEQGFSISKNTVQSMQIQNK